MAQAVEGTVQTLQQNARQKDDFVAAFTHELKTPMTSILGFADILRSGEVSPATRRTAADYIYHESKRLEALSGNLLALMGLEQQPPQLEAVPLGRVLQSLRRALREWLDKGRLSPAERNAIAAWAEQTISGAAAARYLVHIVHYTEGREENRPAAPWAPLKETAS